MFNSFTYRRAGVVSRPQYLLWCIILAGTIVVGLAQKADAMSDIQCEIRSRPFAAGMEVSGFVWSDHNAVGSYSFIVNKEGSSGSSHVVQRGLLSLEANHPQIVGTISVNTRSGDKYLARLTVTAEGNDYVCSTTLS